MSLARGRHVLEIEAKAILALIDRLDQRFERAVSLMDLCQGRVVVTGIGKSGIIGRKIAATLASIGIPSAFLHPAEGIHGDLGMVSRGDVVLAISNSGETEELLKILPALKRLGVPLISLIGKLDSILGKNSDVVLDVSVEEEACPLDLAPTASTTAALALGDALAMALLERKGIKPEDFARYHPGGSLGKRLLLTVEDLMHREDAIPKVRPKTALKDVIYEISSKKIGMTTVTDESGRLRGVITDGDLRRVLEKGGDNLLARSADAVMSKDPKVIVRTALAAEAVGQMERYAITVLVVADAGLRVEGVIHLHDLLKAGVV
ncbi:MAG: KpsF/GutQ family sugar-phosphate isomerase [Nitrospirae bacterium]|nr:KpsF/GutQ family sugar-phosphate isomerase [Nitrospirota bacterium]